MGRIVLRPLFVLVLLAAATGAAQAADPAPLRAQLDELRAELGRIQLAQAQDPNLRTAALEVRLSRLEELIRQLTGRIEEVEYAQRQTSARILIISYGKERLANPNETEEAFAMNRRAVTVVNVTPTN